ncbi:hypothetical protein EVAR_32877_1 [Eumeta japonica]|uniref:Uncharacterized protein n=1 Tax=Eumeta variegata TaxID=151549 RepID=A0A4C1VPI9_EUMVA|nr:hypothetical protein EVAR_32877_1 [Eumeta japonica]
MILIRREPGAGLDVTVFICPQQDLQRECDPVRDGGLMLPHARTSSRRGDDPDGPVVMVLFQGSKLERLPSQPKIKRSCQWVHQHHPRPSQPSLGVMVKWWVAAPYGSKKFNEGEP